MIAENYACYVYLNLQPSRNLVQISEQAVYPDVLRASKCASWIILSNQQIDPLSEQAISQSQVTVLLIHEMSEMLSWIVKFTNLRFQWPNFFAVLGLKILSSKEFGPLLCHSHVSSMLLQVACQASWFPGTMPAVYLTLLSSILRR